MQNRRVRQKKKSSMGLVRIGFGYDIHQLSVGRTLVLGGIRIPSNRGLAGHSDADVLLHAICDALLGAAALPDIGRIFPNTNKKYRGISSLILLKRVNSRLRQSGYSIGNIDSTIILEEPKIAAFIDAMRRKIGKALGLSPQNVSVKATTNEGLGTLGKKEGCAAFAVAAVFPREKNT
jgi:2-C-methyl-D-erythritol 2,4-cyclodiphosphate synthase